MQGSISKMQILTKLASLILLRIFVFPVCLQFSVSSSSYFGYE